MTPIPILFAGPSLVGLEPALIDGFELRPPARRGDFDAILGESLDPKVIILSDGVFHQCPSVGHAEIRRTITAGWQVWGVSSMGAIRAAEMRGHGMLGFGQVYQRFVDDPDFADDEVALLHLGEPPYIPVTEPLIHMRLFVSGLRDDGLLGEGEEIKIIDELKGLWYGKRYWSRMGEILERETHLTKAEIAERMLTLPKFRRKNLDLEQLLRERPWIPKTIP